MLPQPRARGRLLRGYQRGQDAPGGVQEGSGTVDGRRTVPRVAPGRSRGWRLPGGTELSPGGNFCSGEVWGPGLARKGSVPFGASWRVPRGTWNRAGGARPSYPGRATRFGEAPIPHCCPIPPAPQRYRQSVLALGGWVASRCVTSLSPAPPGTPRCHCVHLPRGAGGAMPFAEAAGWVPGQCGAHALGFSRRQCGVHALGFSLQG